MNGKQSKRKKKTPPVPPGRIRLELSDRPGQKVFVAGTFNNWEPATTPLLAQGEGRWAVELDLPPGQYEYRFIVDEQWIDDPRATEFVPNVFGGINCIFTVSAPESALPGS